MLRTFELTEARNCLGKVLYQAMLEDLAEYPEAAPYSSITEYAIDDVVIYDYTLFRAIAITTGSLPVDETKWELAPRFQTGCFNVLFCTVLAEFLAWVVVKHRMPFINTKISGTGLIKNKSGNFEAANEHDYNSLMAGAAKMVQMTWNNLVDFMEDNKDNACYAGFKSFTCTSCGCVKLECGCTKTGGYTYEFA